MGSWDGMLNGTTPEQKQAEINKRLEQSKALDKAWEDKNIGWWEYMKMAWDAANGGTAATDQYADLLTKQYPNYAQQIQMLRGQGFSEDQIRTHLFGEEAQARLYYSPQEVDQQMGRTPESKADAARIQNRQRVEALSQASGLSAEDVEERIKASELTGVPAEMFINDPQLYKDMAQGIKMREGYLESMQRGAKNFFVLRKAAGIGIDRFLGAKDRETAQKEYDEVMKEYEAPPEIMSGTQKAVEGAAGIYAQGLSTGGRTWVAGMLGAVPGMLMKNPALAAKGAEAAASAMAAKELFVLQAGADMIEFERMLDENGKPLDPNAARAAALITGAITAFAELAGLPAVLKRLPGGDAVAKLLEGGATKQSIKEMVMTASGREALMQLAKDTGIGALMGGFNNAIEATGSNVGRALAQEFSGQKFPDAPEIDWAGDFRRGMETATHFLMAGGPKAAWQLGQAGRAAMAQRNMTPQAREAFKGAYEAQVKYNEAQAEADAAAKENRPEAEVSAAQERAEAARVEAAQAAARFSEEMGGEGSPSPEQEGSPSPEQEGSPSPVQEGSPSRVQEGSPSPEQEGSPSLVQEGSPSLVQEGSPSRPAGDSPLREGAGDSSPVQGEAVDGVDIEELRTQEAQAELERAQFFVPRTDMEIYAQENPGVLEELGIDLGEMNEEAGEVMLRGPQLMALAERAPALVESMRDDIRRGVKGKTNREAYRMIEEAASKDPMWRLQEVKDFETNFAQQMAAAGRPETEAKAEARVLTSFGIVMARRSGKSFAEVTNVTVKSLQQSMNEMAEAARRPQGQGQGYEQIGKKRKAEMDALLARRRTDMTPEQRAQTIDEIEKLGEETRAGGNPKLEKAATKWVQEGHIVLPEDNYKVVDAMKLAEEHGLDPMRFNDPNEILAKYTHKETKAEKRVNPDTVPEFSNKQELPNGITVYTVQDDQAGQAATRKIIDTHWGEDANPWCLAARQGGNLDDAWDMWNNYNKTGKRIAFQNGKLLAFSASDREQVQWWDREDKPSNGIPYTVKKDGDTVVYMHDEATSQTRKLNEILKDGTERTWYEDGETPKIEKLPDGTQRHWHPNGKMASEWIPDGTERRWFANGALEYEKTPGGKSRFYQAKDYVGYRLATGEEITNVGGQWQINGTPVAEGLGRGLEAMASDINHMMRRGQDSVDAEKLLGDRKKHLRGLLNDTRGLEATQRRIDRIAAEKGTESEDYEYALRDLEMQKRFRRDEQMELDALEALPLEEVRLHEKPVAGTEGYEQAAGVRGAHMLDQYEEVTTRMDNLGVAREMEKSGKDAKAIKLATGWERGADGKWRYEIMDGEVRIPYLRRLREMSLVDDAAYLTLPEIYYAPELYKAYPELKNMRVRMDNSLSPGDAYYDPENNIIGVNIDFEGDKDKKGVLAHEIQHAVQRIEGFARGASLAFWGNLENVYDALNKKINEYLSLMSADALARYKQLELDLDNLAWDENGVEYSPEEYSDAELERDKQLLKDDFLRHISLKERLLWERIEALKSDRAAIMRDDKLDSIGRYFRTSGEIESRNVEGRVDMSAGARRSTLLAETEDVAREDQIILRDGIESYEQRAWSGDNFDISQYPELVELKDRVEGFEAEVSRLGKEAKAQGRMFNLPKDAPELQQALKKAREDYNKARREVDAEHARKYEARYKHKEKRPLTVEGITPHEGPVRTGRYTDLNSLIAAAISPEGQKVGGSIFMDFAPVSDATADRVAAETGVDIHGLRHAIDGSGIVHMLSGHGENGTRLKDYQNQIPLTAADIAMIPDVIENADSVEATRESNRVFFRKRVNGHIIVLEETRTNFGKLMPVTAWKETASKKNDGGLSQTSETSSTYSGPVSAAPDLNITSQNEDVNNEAYKQSMYHAGQRELEGGRFKIEYATGERGESYGHGIYLSELPEIWQLHTQGKGYRYTVEGPENDMLLNWDERLDQQPHIVRAKLDKMLNELDERTKKDFGYYLQHIGRTADEISGADLYYFLSHSMRDTPRASMMLNEAGIPGLRVADYEIKGAPTTFVVWDTDFLKVMGVEGPQAQAAVEAYEQAQREQNERMAPNGEKSNLTARQWDEVRTEEFKGWFGDWEKTATKERLINGDMISVQDRGNELIKGKEDIWAQLVDDYGKNKQGAPKQLFDFLRPLIPRTITNINIGDIGFTNNSIRNSLHHKNGKANAIVLPYIKEILESAEYVGARPIEGNRTSYILAKPLLYKEQRFIMLMVVNEDVQGKKYYDHEFTTIKKIDSLPTVLRKSKTTEVGQTHQSLLSILAEDVWNNNASKVVDENGEPLVVWHGTGTPDITEFKHSKAQDKAGRALHMGQGRGKFYLATTRMGAENAASGAVARGDGKTPTVMPLYVNMKAPLTLAEYEQRYQEMFGHGLYDGYEAGYTQKDRDANIARLDKQLKKEGYDGIFDRDAGVVAPFSPTQIKSATDNIGTFDPNNLEIYKQSMYHAGQRELEGGRFKIEYATGERGESYGHGIYLSELPEIWQLHTQGKGYRYTVEGPENDMLLNWDERLDQQPHIVRAKLEKMLDGLDERTKKDFGYYLQQIGRTADEISGADLYYFLSHSMRNTPRASMMLNEAGIPGLRVADYEIKGAPTTFVVWDTDFLKVMGVEGPQAQAAVEAFEQSGRYPGPAEMSPQARGRLAKHEAMWSSEVDRVVADMNGPNAIPYRHQVNVMQTPEVLRLLGVKRLQIRMDAGKIKKIFSDHPEMTDALLKQLPRAMTDPIAVYDSDTLQNSLVIMTELQDTSGATVIGILHLDKQAAVAGIDIHRMASAYGKANKSGPNNQWFIDQANKGNLRYVDTQKSAQWAFMAGVVLPPVMTPTGHGNNILTRADLVKAWQSDTYYQSSGKGAQTKTPAFKEFFGDWENDPENASKVVDENGEPLVVYHGTPREKDAPRIEVFDAEGKPFWFTPSKEYAGAYASHPARYEEGTHKKETYPVFLNARNLAGVGELNATGDGIWEKLSAKTGIPVEELRALGIDAMFDGSPSLWKITNDAKFKDLLASKGYDGMTATEGGIPTYAVFSPEQIKSATDNAGTFDRNDPNIYKQSIGERGAAMWGEGMGEAVNARTSWPEGSKAWETPSMMEFFRTANQSTGFHELGHHMLRVMMDLSEMEGVAPDLVQDTDIILKNAGVTREQWANDKDARRRAHEFFAQSFETYLAEGRAPNNELKGVFERVRQWMIDVYHNVVQALGIQLNDEMRGVFDRILATPAEIDARTTTEALAREEAAVMREIRDVEAAMREEAEGEIPSPPGPISAEAGEMPAPAWGDEWGPAPELSQDATEAVDGWLDQWERHAIQSDAAEAVQNVVNLIKQHGGLRLADFVHQLGEELAREVRAKWPGLFRNTTGNEALSLDVLTEQLQAAGINLDVGGLVRWLQETANEKPQKPAPLVEVNVDTLNALVDRLGVDGARQYMSERSRYLAQLQKGLQAQYEQDKSNEQAKADLEATYREQREIRESMEALDRVRNAENPDREMSDTHTGTGNERMGLPEGVSDAAEPEAPEQVPMRARPQEATLTLYEAMRRGYQMAERASREAFREGRREGREAEAARAKERLADLEVKRRLQVQSERAKASMRLKALRERLRKIAEVKKETVKLVRRLRRMGESESIIWAKQREIRGILEGYDLKKRSKATMQRRALVEEWLRSDPETARDLTAEDLKYLGTTTLGEMSLEELRELDGRVSALYEEGQREFQAWEAAQKERRNGINKELRESLNKRKANKPPVRKNQKDMGKQYKGVTGKLAKIGDWTYARTLGRDRFFDWLDGGRTEYKGAFVRHFVDALNAKRDEALKHKFARRKRMQEKLLELGYKDGDFSRIATTIDGVSYTWSEIQELYLGMRNEEKARAIVYGNFVNSKNKRAYTPEQAQEIIAYLIGMLDDDMKAAAELVVQDHEANFPRINNALIESTNRGMEQVDVYTSIHRMEHMSPEGLINADVAEQIVNGQASAGVLRRVEKGFTISRNRKISDKNQAPVKLGLWENWHGDVSAHEHAAAMAGIAKDLTGALMVQDEDGQTVAKMVRDRFGNEAWQSLVGFFNDDIMDDARIAHGVMDNVSGFLARNMSIAYLAGNLGTVIKQTASYPRFLITAGPKRLLVATAKFLQDMPGFVERVKEQSPQLRDRAGSEILQMIKQDPNWGKRLHQRVLDLLMAPIGAVDRATCAIGWQATYDANKAALGHEGAKREADRAVRLTQPLTHAKDKSRVWRQSGLARLAMMFTADAAQTWGMTAYDFVQQVTAPFEKGYQGKMNDVAKGFYTLLVMTLCAGWIKAMSEGIPMFDDDDDDENAGWVNWTQSAFTEQAIRSIPIVGKEGMALYESLSGKRRGTQWSAIISPVERAARALKLWRDSDDDDDEKRQRAAWLALEALSLSGIAQLPVTGLRRALQSALITGEYGWVKGLQHIIGWRPKLEE